MIFKFSFIRKLWGWLVWPLILLAMGLIYYKSASFDFDGHERIQRALQNIKEHDALLNQNVLRTRYYLDRNYDAINDSIFKIHSSLDFLKHKDQGALATKGVQIKNSLEKYESTYQKRKVLLDDFKGANAILKNSLYYFPISVKRVNRLTGKYELLNSILKEVILYNLTGENELQKNVKAKLKQLKSLRSSLDGEAAKEVDILTRHIENILENKVKTDNLVRRVVFMPALKQHTALAAAYESYHLKELYYTNIYRLLLFTFSAVLLIYIIYSLAKLGLARWELEAANRNLSRVNRSFERFVPLKFLELLEQKQITRVKLGDCRKKYMSVLFADIRSFTNLSESMSPEENFAFINSYLSLMGPIIREHNGFIDKYIGDAIMALFDMPVDNALRAGVAMLKSLEEFNKNESNHSIRIGIGLHAGQMMLGTVGDHMRMQGTVISDSVNMASRTESLTKEYGISFLITEAVQMQLDNPEEFKLRFIDRVRVKGKTNLVTIFEVCETYSPELQALKMSAGEFIEAGMEYLEKGELDQAEEKFQAAAGLETDDRVAAIQLEKIFVARKKAIEQKAADVDFDAEERRSGTERREA